MLGQTISHYRVTGRLGYGGMGVVYEAEDTRLPRKVALKFLPEELVHDPDAERRFKREADTVAVLNHPHICTIYEIDRDARGRPFIAMECVEGVNLKTYMTRRPLETPELLDIAVQITRALEAAHAKGIVHRDIKPGNVMVTDPGHVKVLDFGLARRFQMPETGEPGQQGSTVFGRPVGTVNYMAPERILQIQPADPRSDLFSVGVVIFEMATGRLPFAGASPPETVTNILEKEPPAITALAPDRPTELARLVRRVLSKAARERPQTASELREALLELRAPSGPPLGKGFWQRMFGR